MFCSGNVLSNNNLVGNINTEGCRKAIIKLAQYGVKVLSSVLVAVTIIMVRQLDFHYLLYLSYLKFITKQAIIIALVQYLLILIRKEMALYNAKNKYSTLEEFDEAMDYLN